MYWGVFVWVVGCVFDFLVHCFTWSRFMLVFGFLLDCLSHVKKLFQTLVIAGDPVWNRMWLRRLTRPSICNVLAGAAAQACFVFVQSAAVPLSKDSPLRGAGGGVSPAAPHYSLRWLMFLYMYIYIYSTCQSLGEHLVGIVLCSLARPLLFHWLFIDFWLTLDWLLMDLSLTCAVSEFFW